MLRIAPFFCCLTIMLAVCSLALPRIARHVRALVLLVAVFELILPHSANLFYHYWKRGWAWAILDWILVILVNLPLVMLLWAIWLGAAAARRPAREYSNTSHD